MPRVRIGFVGTGSMGQCAHLQNYVTVPDCEVVAIAEIRPELGRKVAARYGVPGVYQSHTEMLAQESLDGIVSAQPFTRHGLLVPELLSAGIPLFTEKPLASSVQVGESILNSLAESNTWHMVGYHKRSDPATMYAKKEIDGLKQTGELGKLRYVRITMPAGDWVAGGFNNMIRSNESYPQLASDPAPADMDSATYEGYLSFINYYIHQVNLMRHLLGENYVVTYAEPSGVMLAVQSVGGVSGVIEMSPYTTTTDWHETAFVGFEHGYVKISLPAPLAMNRPGRVEIMRDPGHGQEPQTIFPTLPWVHAMRQQAISFVKAIKGECQPPCDAHEALEDLKVARQYIGLLNK